MNLSTYSIKAETAYRRERTKREFRVTPRNESQQRAPKPEPRHARRALRPTQAA